MAEILLLGAFGQRNVGDEALCRAVSRTLAGHDVVIASANPDSARTAHGRRAIPATPAGVAKALRTADAVVVGGGTLFKALHTSSGRRPNALLANTAALIAAARLRHVPVALVGVGAGELRGGVARSLARRIVRQASLVVLRDEESAAVLTDAGVAPPFWIGADLGWLLFDSLDTSVDGTPVVQPRPIPRGGGTTPPGPRRVTVAVSHLAGGTELEAGIASAVARLAADGWQVRLQPWHTPAGGGGDVAVARWIARAVPGAEIVPAPAGLEAAAADLAGDDLVIAMRFHALVAAGAARRRVVAVAHEPKLAGLARRLDQIAVPPGATAGVIDTAIDWALTHPAPTAAAVHRQIELAGHTAHLLRVLIDPGALEHPDELHALALSDGNGLW